MFILFGIKYSIHGVIYQKQVQPEQHLVEHLLFEQPIIFILFGIKYSIHGVIYQSSARATFSGAFVVRAARTESTSI